jgi:FkbM family methyltransferase
MNRENNQNITSPQAFIQAPRMIISSQDAEDYLSEQNYGIKKKMIHYMFRHKEVIKKTPIIGNILIKRKNNMIKESYKNSNSGRTLQLDHIIELNFEEFIQSAYNLLLGREPDAQGLIEYRQHVYLGASNAAIIYMIASSCEYNHRFEISKIKRYEKGYRKYLRKRSFHKLPFIGDITRIKALSNHVLLLSNQLDGIYYKLNETVKNFENSNSNTNSREIDCLNDLSFRLGNMEKVFCKLEDRIGQIVEDRVGQILEKRIGEIIENRVGQVLIEQMGQVTDNIERVNNKVEYYCSAVAQKIDFLPDFIKQNNIKNKSMITSLSNGVIAVQAGDFIMGIPSEEWGLAMYLSQNGYFEAGSERLFCNLIKEEMTVIDIGANLGIYTLHALKAGCKVYSYEPTPFTYDLLNKNIKVNGYLESNRAVTYNYAVGDKEKIVKFSIYKGVCGQNHITDEEEADNTIEVPVVSIDHQHEGEKIDFIKIDIEGAEYDAFKGMKNIIQSNPDIMILMEFAPVFIRRAGVDPKDLLKLIEEYGLKIQKIDENTSKLFELDENELLNENSINLLLSFNKIYV